MPNYDYACKTCLLTMTITRKINDTESKPICVNCAKEMIRVFDSPVVTFNSPGFYKTEGKI